ncbi:MAG: hypothetical protein QOD44_3262 [Solirubrobacteraceae bacterium]|nr:hypothetical protein [Solirubrobacteraceae bacterium]
MPIFGRRDNEPRSASEREAARLERERRRLEREGRGLPENGAAGAEPSGDAADEPSGGLWTGAPDDGAHAAGDAPAHPDAAQPAEPDPEVVDPQEQVEPPAPESVGLDEQAAPPEPEGVDPPEQAAPPVFESVDSHEEPEPSAPEGVDPPEQPEQPAPAWPGETAASAGGDAGDDPAQPAAPGAGDEVSPGPHEHADTPERPPADERFERRHEGDAVAWGSAAGDESDPRAAAWPAPQTPAAQAGRGESRADLDSRGAGEGAGADDGGGDAAGTPGPAGRAHDPDATQPFDALGTDDRRRTVSLPRPQTDTGEYDAPIGTVRVNRAGGYEAQPGASGYPAYRKLGVQKPRRRWLRRIVALLALLAVVAVAVFLYFLYQPAHGPGFGRVQVSIPQGATASQIGDILEKQGVVDSAFFFSLRARLSGKREQLRSGRYTLRQSMPYDAALTALTTAPKAAAVLNVTLPEGPSRREAAPLVRRAGVRGDYLAATRTSSRLRPRDYGAPRSTRTLEGFLYPATYELRQSQATARRLVNRQVAAFKDAFAKVDMSRARRKNLTRYDVLIIASMIEREGLVARERRLISAVIYNRLKQGIPLGIDATIRYALNNWSRPLRVSELQRDTPFNTRLRKGLPPTPIGNPGLPAMRAAANPANVNYIFYVVKPCGNGAHAFSSTDAQFQRDVAAYNRARARRGGKDPSRC